MDNRQTLEGYKYYLEADTGARPSVFVTFLNLVEDLGTTVNGVVLPVSKSEIESLDQRERNYDRVDVTDRIVEPVDGSVWAYVGDIAAGRRYDEGLRQGAAVVDASYYESVRGRFQSLGNRAYRDFLASTDEPACPIRRLRRVDL
jgi:gamma-glutamylcyclotransferase (GGCT)/AIG2-like uncharacterized protein YtfP